MAKKPDQKLLSQGAAGLLARPPSVVNIGLESFATELEQNGAKVTHVVWQPPARGDAALAKLLSKLGS